VLPGFSGVFLLAYMLVSDQDATEGQIDSSPDNAERWVGSTP